MCKSLVFLLSCLSSLALAVAQTETPPDPAPAEETPAEEAPAEETSAEESEDAGPSEEELAALEEAASKAAQEEQVRLAKAAAERESAKGEKHAALTTSRGRTYKKVVIKGVDEVGVKITHEYGTARIKFSELPEEFQARFGYDPSRAKDLLEREKNLESARARASIAALRANAGLPATTATRPTATKPKTTRPKTTKPKTTKPKTTKPVEAAAAPPSDNAEVQAMVAKIAELEQFIAKRRPEAEAFQEKASDSEDQAFKGIGGAGGDPKVSQKKLKEAKDWRDKADAVYAEISTTRVEMGQLRRKIKMIERNSKKK
ncbi:MAG: hypothetical protein QF405_08110 [Roseibacillus sp.]|jgi:hypothetical protein|nr:hypothetical protein [Roseibacillus sp.]HJM64933.1 hypothetical protein [Roseibacillus sp.]|tara:strand:+ start:4496 stop:5446 length:951 start_codon:yes stop_codon:yes gene_type:complete